MTKIQAAAWFLKAYLQENGGRAPSSQIKDAAVHKGHSERTLKRARPLANIEVVAEGMPRKTFWIMPDWEPAAEPVAAEKKPEKKPGPTLRPLPTLNGAEFSRHVRQLKRSPRNVYIDRWPLAQ